MSRRASADVIGVLALVLGTACATPSAPQLLADRTAANAGVIGAQLRALARDSGDVTDLRAANVARLHAANAQSRASYNYDIALTKKAGGEANVDLADQLDDWGKEVDAIFKAAENAERERKAAVLATDTRSEALAQLAEALAALARDDSPAERAKFLAGHAGEVRKELDKQLEQSNKSATNAKAATDTDGPVPCPASGCATSILRTAHEQGSAHTAVRERSGREVSECRLGSSVTLSPHRPPPAREALNSLERNWPEVCAKIAHGQRRVRS
jgi:hypothetical protein